MHTWDERKRKSNAAKHRVDFADMDAFEWDTAYVREDARHEEPRWIATGFIRGVLHFVVYTHAESDDLVRVISLRKATRKENEFHARNQAQHRPPDQ